jgi:hypothetical protein
VERRHFGRDLCFLNWGEATRDAPPAMVRAMSGPTVARDRASVGHDLAASKRQLIRFDKITPLDQKHSKGAIASEYCRVQI